MFSHPHHFGFYTRSRKRIPLRSWEKDQSVIFEHGWNVDLVFLIPYPVFPVAVALLCPRTSNSRSFQPVWQELALQQGLRPHGSQAHPLPGCAPCCCYPSSQNASSAGSLLCLFHLRPVTHHSKTGPVSAGLSARLLALSACGFRYLCSLCGSTCALARSAVRPAVAPGNASFFPWLVCPCSLKRGHPLSVPAVYPEPPRVGSPPRAMLSLHSRTRWGVIASSVLMWRSWWTSSQTCGVS